MTEIPRNAAAGNGAITPVLEIAGVAMHFGGIVALDDVTFAVAAGRIVGLSGLTAPAQPPCSIASAGSIGRRSVTSA
jgi:hypothetical protein